MERLALTRKVLKSCPESIESAVCSIFLMSLGDFSAIEKLERPKIWKNDSFKASFLLDLGYSMMILT